MKMKAWLITWESANNATAVADEVVGILNPCWGKRRVADIVEFLYSSATATLTEIAYYAKRPSNNPYHAEIRSGRIGCGSNPSLYAWKVSDLVINEDPETGIEKITWMESPVYDLVDGRITVVRGPCPGGFTRRITGPVSHELIWDRIRGRFREGWGPGETPVECN